MDVNSYCEEAESCCFNDLVIRLIESNACEEVKSVFLNKVYSKYTSMSPLFHLCHTSHFPQFSQFFTKTTDVLHENGGALPKTVLIGRHVYKPK